MGIKMTEKEDAVLDGLIAENEKLRSELRRMEQDRVMPFRDYLDIQIRCFEGYYKTECTSIDVCLIKLKLDEIMRINGVTII